ncbi:hypothetical protein WN943_010743 [Citrus x changshan-huyou]
MNHLYLMRAMTFDNPLGIDPQFRQQLPPLLSCYCELLWSAKAVVAVGSSIMVQLCCHANVERHGSNRQPATSHLREKRCGHDHEDEDLF